MRKSSTSWSDTVKERNTKLKEQLITLLDLNVEEVVLEGLGNYVRCGTRLLLELLMDAEARQYCGERYERSDKRTHRRWGKEQGTALVNGVKEPVTKPRVRAMRNFDDSCSELQLETYKAMNRNELMDGPLMAAILAGVSSRRYASIVQRGLEAKGVSKSTVSRKAIAATKPTVDQFRKRCLEKLDLVVLLYDGIHIGKRQMIACIGIDSSGRKHVLALRTGATENDIVCRDLIRDLVERGLASEKEYLHVVDGSKALVGAIRAAFGQDAAIQRCQEHKIRDVQGYLPVKMRQEVRNKLMAAYNERTEKTALTRLDRIRFELSLVSESATNSLTEGLYETLTLHRLGITGLLKASLRTTNIMESAFSSVRRYLGRVSKYRDEAQIELWAIRSILETERHFRALRGARQLAKLKEALKTYRRTGTRAYMLPSG